MALLSGGELIINSINLISSSTTSFCLSSSHSDPHQPPSPSLQPPFATAASGHGGSYTACIFPATLCGVISAIFDLIPTPNFPGDHFVSARVHVGYTL